MKEYLKHILFFGLWLLIPYSFSQDTKAIFQTANTYYKNKQYEEAEKMYALLLQKEHNNINAYYNLGNTYFHLKQYPEAILNYEKALKLQPDNKHILHNIKETNNKLFTKIEFSKEFFVKQQLRNIVQSKSSNHWSLYMLITLWLGAMALCFYFIFSNKLFFRLGSIALVAAIVFSWLTYQTNTSEQKHDFAVVIPQNVTLKNAPVENLPATDSVQAGLKVQIIDTDKNWIKVKLPNDRTGWLQKNQLSII